MFIRNERSIKEFTKYYPIVSTLIIIYIVLWLFTNVLPLKIGEDILHWGIGFNAFIFEGQYWRLFTATFLHADFSHVMFNSISLILFGPALEQMLGKSKFLIAYFAAGLIGNIASLFVLELYQPHLGASGSIYGLFGIYLYMVWKRKDLISSTNAQLIMTIFIIGVVMTFIQPSVNVSAHLFGALGGFLIAPLALTKAKPFSTWRRNQYAQTSSYSNRDGVEVIDVKFDPDRWKKRKVRKPLNLNFIFIIIIALAVISLLARFF